MSNHTIPEYAHPLDLPPVRARATRTWLRAGLVPAALVVATAACGAVEDAPDPMDPDGDTTAPAIASTVPAMDAAGVAGDQVITIAFSEPMNQASVVAAYASADLPASEVTFAWSAAGDELTITAKALLAYAEGEGSDPSQVPAKRYGVTIGAAAMDLAGNPLAAGYELGFSTKRRMTTSLMLVSDLSRSLANTIALPPNYDIWLGDAITNATYTAYLSFDLSPLPASATVESASFGGEQATIAGVPYDLGEVQTAHVSYGSMEVAAAAIPLSMPGVFSADPLVEAKSIDVTGEAADDVTHRAARGDLSQFRLQFDQATDSDGSIDRAEFTKSSFAMTMVYTAD